MIIGRKNKQTFGLINDVTGVPGSGKTMIVTTAALDQVHVWKQELKKKMKYIEGENLDINFNLINRKVVAAYFRYYQKELYNEESINNKVKKEKWRVTKRHINLKLHEKRKCIWEQLNIRVTINDIKEAENIDFYQLQFTYYQKKDYPGLETFMRDYYYYFSVTFCKDMIYSNYPIYDKESHRYSGILSFWWFAVACNKDVSINHYKRLIEPYSVFVFDEIDKEYHSYIPGKHTDEKNPVGNKFVATLQMIRHLTNNKGMVFFAHQIESSCSFQIRANSEKFINLSERKQDKMPTIALKVGYKLSSLFYSISNGLHETYVKSLKTVKGSKTMTNSLSKKNNITFFGSLFLNQQYRWAKVMRNLEDNYCVYNLSAAFTNTAEEKKKSKKFEIIKGDISGSYQSTFFFGKHLVDLTSSDIKTISFDNYQSLTPSGRELMKCKSSFYDEFFELLSKGVINDEKTVKKGRKIKEVNEEKMNEPNNQTVSNKNDKQEQKKNEIDKKESNEKKEKSLIEKHKKESFMLGEKLPF